jgi:tetratricopeptide (TPR) repeat protein
LQASEYYRQRLEKSPNDPELHYNFGTAAYKNNMQDDAIEAFTKALKSDNVELQKKAYFNRGNSYYQKGAEVQQADPKTTLNQWKQAVSSLESALQLDPDDADARHNLEVIKERLEELEEQHQQNQQDQQDQQSEQNQEGQPQQDENGQQDNQEKQQSKDGQPENDPETAKNTGTPFQFSENNWYGVPVFALYLPGEAEAWQLTFFLPADAGLDGAETLSFIYRGIDDLDNVSTKIAAENQFQIFQNRKRGLVFA